MKKQTLYFIVVTIFLLLIIGETALLANYGRDTWLNRVGFLLQIIGVYGIGLGFVQRSEVLKKLPDINEMTSPDPVRFFIGNTRFLFIVSSIFEIGFDKNRTRTSSLWLGYFGQIILILTFPVLLAYFLFHLLVICPFAYFGYLLTSAVVESIAGAAGDKVVEISSNGRIEDKFQIKEIITSNPSAAKSFLIGIPALFLAFVAKLIGMFFA